ncbi:radical SAM protein [bacterium]|nr:radical SAM protein [bacterium]
MIKVCEIFHSLIGEGSYVGQRAIILRLTGCNLRCRWCDTAYAWNEGDEYDLDSIMNKLQKWPCKRILVTGGEPLIQNDVYELFNILHLNNFEILLETNGSLDLSPLPGYIHKIMDLKPPGSGMDKHNLWKNLDYILPTDDVKFVIMDRNDFDWSIKVVKKYALNTKTSVYFTAVWGKLSSVQLAEWIKECREDIRLGFQLHKMLWGEKRGV